MRVIALILVLCSGCRDELAAACEDLQSTEPELTIGTGSTAFEPLTEVTSFEFGPQGGYHVYASFQVTGLYGGDPDDLNNTLPEVSFTYASENNAVTGGFESASRLFSLLPDGRYERVGDLAVLDNEDPSTAEGVLVQIQASVTDQCGRSADTTAQTTLTEAF